MKTKTIYAAIEAPQDFDTSSLLVTEDVSGDYPPFEFRILPDAQPVDMLLHCPNCGKQHIDAPDTNYDPHYEGALIWDNPPHRSHLCHYCGCIWRPADVATNGVAEIKTKGKADTWSATSESRPQGDAQPVAHETPSTKSKDIAEAFRLWLASEMGIGCSDLKTLECAEHLVSRLDCAFYDGAKAMKKMLNTAAHGVPDGWAFYSADFSLQVNNKFAMGTVLLSRDSAGRTWWHSLDEAARETTPLYLCGNGATIAAAIADAASKIINAAPSARQEKG
jgi:hypothetical protein